MKKLLLSAIALFAIGSVSVYAQRTVRCSAQEYREQQLAAHPEQQAQIDQVEAQTALFEQQHPNGYQARTILVVPVVFHVVYKTAAQNISTARINEQIQILNEDYRKLNSDINLVPAVWQGLAADCEIQFCLAQRDPAGNYTTGIERIQTQTSSFTFNDGVKSTATGGANSWDNLKYLNIWVCNLTGGLLGYSTFPGAGPGNLDGCVIGYPYIGKTGATAPYNLGRTCTHEIGHYFNMRHIWADEPACNGSDLVSDTPNQGPENYGTPTFPHTDACQTASPGVMFMNYMDYVDDNAMFMFTAGQKTRMWAAINNQRPELLTSDGCTAVGVAEAMLKYSFSIFPSPTNGAFSLDFGDNRPTNFDVSISNVLGQTIYTHHYDALNESEIHLDLEGNPAGIYFIEVRNAKERVTRKIVLN